MMYGDEMRQQGFHNVHDKHPPQEGEYLVVDHNGNRFISYFHINKFGTPCWMISGKYKDKGYDICWWKEKKDE